MAQQVYQEVKVLEGVVSLVEEGLQVSVYSLVDLAVVVFLGGCGLTS